MKYTSNILRVQNVSQADLRPIQAKRSPDCFQGSSVACGLVDVTKTYALGVAKCVDALFCPRYSWSNNYDTQEACRRFTLHIQK